MQHPFLLLCPVLFSYRTGTTSPARQLVRRCVSGYSAKPTTFICAFFASCFEPCWRPHVSFLDPLRVAVVLGREVYSTPGVPSGLSCRLIARRFSLLSPFLA